MHEFYETKCSRQQEGNSIVWFNTQTLTLTSPANTTYAIIACAWKFGTTKLTTTTQTTYKIFLIEGKLKKRKRKTLISTKLSKQTIKWILNLKTQFEAIQFISIEYTATCNYFSDKR